MCFDANTATGEKRTVKYKTSLPAKPYDAGCPKELQESNGENAPPRLSRGFQTPLPSEVWGGPILDRNVLGVFGRDTVFECNWAPCHSSEYALSFGNQPRHHYHSRLLLCSVESRKVLRVSRETRELGTRHVGPVSIAPRTVLKSPRHSWRGKRADRFGPQTMNTAGAQNCGLLTVFNVTLKNGWHSCPP